MPLNLLKKYNKLLELNSLSEHERDISLKGIFERDIVNNDRFIFREKKIRPIKSSDGTPALDTLFCHLTCKSEDVVDDNGNTYKSRNIFDFKRSERLHWIWHHIQEREPSLKIFSTEDRIKGKTQIRTYLYNDKEKYVIVLQPYRKTNDYYLLSAYYLDEEYGVKNINKKYKRKLDEIY